MGRRASREIVVLGVVAAALMLAVPSRALQCPAAHSSFASEFRCAASFYQAHKLTQARQALEPMLRAFPDDYRVHELAALVLDQQHLPDQAEREFKKAADLAPQDYEMNHNLGEFYIREGKIADAVPYLKKAQNLHASYDNGYDLALAEIKTAQYPAAQREIRRMLGVWNSAELHELLAGADEKAGEYVAAANEYALAARMDPAAENIFAWGSELLLHHTILPAIEVFTRGAQLHPHSVRLQIGLGIALYSSRRYADAYRAMCRAIDLKPDEARSYLILGQMYDMAPAASPCATAHFARFAQIQPRNPKALYYYALSLWEGAGAEGRAAAAPKAESLLEGAIRIDPGFGEAHLELGIAYAAKGDNVKAIGEYREAVRLEPNRADAHYRLARALLRKGDRAAAQKEFEAFNRLHERQSAEWEKRRQSIVAFAIAPQPAAPR